MFEINPLRSPQAYHANKVHAMTLSELESNGGTVTRVRLLAGKTNGAWFFEISYVDGTLPTGEIVMIKGLPALDSPNGLADSLRQWADEEGVDAEEINLMNDGIWSFIS